MSIYKNYLGEVELLSHSNHRNIAKMVDSLRNFRGALYIIMEHFEEGNLYQKRLTDVGTGYYKEHEVIDILRQICEGVSYINGKGAAHRDIDPNNFMTHKGLIKIVDFGLACHLNAETRFDKSMVGKVKFAAPEMFSGKPYNAQKADVYSIGIVHYFLMTGKDSYEKDDKDIPLSSFSNMNTLQDIILPSIYSQDLRKLMIACLMLDPS